MGERQFDNKSEFDKKFEVRREHMSDVHADAYVYLHDDLELCITMARSLFGTDQPAEIVLALYDRMILNQSKS